MIEGELKSSYPAKPSTVDVHLFLLSHQALIVHCSGTPKGIGPGNQPYPHDLQHVWQGGAQGGISCSVIRPGDSFHYPVRHSTGTVGLVVAPISSESIVAVSPNDAGSQVENGVRVVAREVDICVNDLEMSLSGRRDRYNEWVVRNFKVVGLFTAMPATTWQSTPMQGHEGRFTGTIDQEVGISTPEIAADFDGLPIYTFSGNGVLRWMANGWHPVAHSEIYSRLRASGEP